MKKRWMGILCAVLLMLAVCCLAAADSATAPEIEIPQIQAGQDTAFTVNYPADSFSYVDFRIYPRGSDTSYTGEYHYTQEGETSYAFTVRGYILQPGEYTATVRYWDRSASETKTRSQDFTVAEGGQPEAPAVIASSTALYYDSPTRFTLSNTSNYYGYIYFQYAPKGSDWDNPSLNSRWANGNSFNVELYGNTETTGTFDYQIRFCWSQNGIYSPWTDPMDISYTYLGDLPNPEITVASGKTVGQDIPFSFVCEHAETFSATLYRVKEDSSEWIDSLYDENGNYDQTGTSGTIQYPIMEAGTYRLYVQAKAPGYSTGYAEKDFTVGQGTLPAGPQVTLNGGKRVYASTSPEAVVTMAGLDQIRYETWHSLETGDDEKYNDGSPYAEQTGRVSFWPYHYTTGTWKLKVWGHANGKWTEATELSYVVYERQKLSAPVVTLSADTVEAGTDLTITFEGDPLVSCFYYTLEKKNEDGYWTGIVGNSLEDGLLSAVIEGYSLLEAGNYRISCYKEPSDEGYYTSDYTYKEFTVTASALGKATISLEAQDAYYMEQQLSVTFGETYDQVRLGIYLAGENYIWQSSDARNTNKVTFSIDEPGDYVLKGMGKKNGQWTAWSDPIPLKIISRGKLNGGTITLDSASGKLAGYDVSGTVEKDSNAVYVGLDLYRISNGDQYWLNSMDVSGNDPSFLFSGAYFSAGTYRITMNSSASGYENGWTSVEFEVTGSLQKGPKVTPPAEAYIGISAPFSLQLAGATRLKVRYIHAEGYGAPEDELAGDGSFSWTHRFEREGEYNAYASAKINGQWTDWSDPVPFTVTTKGTLAKPVITLPTGTIAAGEDLVIDYTMDSRAEYLYIWLGRVTPDTIQGQLNKYDYNPSGTCLIDGYYLSPGQYRLALQLWAAGYQNSRYEVTFTVTGEEAPAPVVTLDKESYSTCERMVITLDQAYESVCVSEGSRNDRIFHNQQSITWYVPEYETTLYLRVKVKTAGAWSAWTEKTVSITANDRLSTPTITVLRAVVGEDVQMEIGNVENATRYEITLYDADGSWLTNTTLTEAGTVTFDEALFNNGSYRISLYAYGTGYSSSYNSKSFDVTGTRTSALPEVIVGSTTVAGGRVPVVVKAPGADMVRVKRNDYSNYPLYPLTNGRATIFAELYDDITDLSFAARTNGQWSAWTEPVTVERASSETYTTELSDPAVALGADHPTTGNALNVSLSFDSKTTAYHLELLYGAEDSNYLEYPYASDGSVSNGKALVTIPGTELSRSGSYSMQVWAYAPNARSGYTQKTILVTGSSIYAPTPTVTYDVPDTVYVGQQIGFTVSTEEGSISDLKAVYTKTGNNNASYMRLGNGYNGNKATVSFSFSEYVAGCDVTFAVSAKINGVWSGYVEHTFHVNPKKGTVSYPVPRLSSASVTEGDKITVSWDSVQHITGYWAEWYNNDYEWYSQELSASATSFELDTAGLEDGYYTLYLYPQCEDQYVAAINRVFTTFHVRAASTGELRTMTLPTALKVIEEEAFKGTKAQRIVIPSGCTTIGSQAFAFSDQLVRVVIPASVNTIAEDAFVGCESITIETTANSAAARFASAQGFEVIIK